MTCSRCQRHIYLGEDDDARLNPQEEEDRVKKFFKELSNRPQDFNPLPEVSDVETGNPTTPEMVFVELHNKILDAEKMKFPTWNMKSLTHTILSGKHWRGNWLN